VILAFYLGVGFAVTVFLLRSPQQVNEPLLAASIILVMRPWRPAVEHLILLGLFGVMVAELCLQGDQKIPFTCSWLPGKSKFHIAF
jgi:hypothetical protein